MAMSIDEAIQHCEEMALCTKNSECGEEHRQLEEWLRELKRLRAEPVRHGRWMNNHCTVCGMMPMGDEMWELCDFEPPRFEKFMDYCPNCGAKMDLEG